MSAVIKGLNVTLKADIREDYARKIKQAIEMIDGVIKVKTCEETWDDCHAKTQATLELKEKIWKILA